jgi:hypothetical protein
MTENSPIMMVLEATQKISEALQLLQTALRITQADASDGKPVELDLAFLDVPLEAVDWGLDYHKRLMNAFRNWNKFEKHQTEPRPLTFIRDLLMISESELRAAPGVGDQVIARIQAVLAKHGARLRQLA